MTSSLRRRTDIIIRIMRKFPAFSSELELQLNHLVNKLITSINRRYHMVKSKAPEISIENFSKLSLALWSANPSGRGFSQKSKWLRKAAALANLLSAYGAARWGDIAKLHWEDIHVSNKPHGKYVQIYIRISKNNMLNSTPQCITIKEHIEKTLDCPVTLLEAFREYNHQPTQGRIFQGCSGPALLRIAQSMADEMNLPRPTGHSGRISAAVTCSDLNIGMRRTNNFLGWKSDKMYGYYTNIRDQVSNNAPASLLADKNSISKLQLNLFRN